MEGGSTITQQLAKVLFLTPDRSFSRKMKEALLAFELEKRYSKDRLLELYLNQVYMGHGAFGVEAAARMYFGKSVGDLTLPEVALLAALPRSPGNYSPFEHPELAQRRRAIVLSRLVEQGYIGEAEAKAANRAPLGLVAPERRRGSGQYSSSTSSRASRRSTGATSSTRAGSPSTPRSTGPPADGRAGPAGRAAGARHPAGARDANRQGGLRAPTPPRARSW